MNLLDRKLLYPSNSLNWYKENGIRKNMLKNLLNLGCSTSLNQNYCLVHPVCNADFSSIM